MRGVLAAGDGLAARCQLQAQPPRGAAQVRYRRGARLFGVAGADRVEDGQVFLVDLFGQAILLAGIEPRHVHGLVQL